MSTRWSVRYFTADAVRAAEQRTLELTSERELMDLAAHAIAQAAMQHARRLHGAVAGASVALLVGTGKNGGDALFAGIHLIHAGAHVTAFLSGPTAFNPALDDFKAAGGIVMMLGDHAQATFHALAAATVVIDGLVGLGSTPGLREPAASAIEYISPRARVIAVDIPSGVDVDTGNAELPHVRAHTTVTFAARKACLALPPAALAAGDVVVANLGIGFAQADAIQGLSSPTDRDIAAMIPVPQPEDHKYSRAVLGVIAGSQEYPGAAVLTVSGAWRTGCGMVHYVGPSRATDLVLATRPETVCFDTTSAAAELPTVDAWVLGPGIGTDPHQIAAAKRALASDLPCIVDADAIAILAAKPRLMPTVVTPHASELARALSSLGQSTTREAVERDPAQHATALATLLKSTVALKGAVTLIAQPEGDIVSVPSGPPYLATAGAGDVLAGVMGALAASGVEIDEAAVVAVWLHGAAAHHASQGGPIVAMDVAGALPHVIATLTGRA